MDMEVSATNTAGLDLDENIIIAHFRQKELDDGILQWLGVLKGSHGLGEIDGRHRHHGILSMMLAHHILLPS